jgi:MYXO-CTERM domain-containing protein
MAGAMLFGGTLGMVGAADAGLIWDSGNVYVPFNCNNVTNFVSDLGGGSATSGANSLTLSPLTSTGFSITATNPGNVSMLFGDYWIGFSLSESTTITISGTAPAGNVNGLNNIYITNLASGSNVFDISPVSAAYSNQVTLAAGSYQVGGVFGVPAGSGYSGTMMNFSVPAPGALALLAIAGFAGSRRRRD